MCIVINYGDDEPYDYGAVKFAHKPTKILSLLGITIIIYSENLLKNIFHFRPEK